MSETTAPATAVAKLPDGTELLFDNVGKGIGQVVPLFDSEVKSHRFGRGAKRWNVAKALASIEGGSQQQQDPFSGFYARGGRATRLDPLTPDTPLRWLARLRNMSNILGPSIASLERNVAGHGVSLVPRLDADDPRREQFAAEIEVERLRCLELLGSIHPKHSLEKLRGIARGRAEGVGFGGWEVIRDQDGRPAMLEPVWPQLLRMTPVDSEIVNWEQPIYDAERMEWASRPMPRKFRRWVTFRNADHADKVYLKEYGDPRTIGATTGESYADDAAAFGAGEAPANEFLSYDIVHVDGTYPLPRYAGVIDEIVGSWWANKLNQSRFENPIPPLVVLVSGGTLVDASTERIQEMFAESAMLENQNAPLVLQAEPMGTIANVAGMGGSSTVRMEVVPLDRVIADDGLYQNYDANNRDKIRASFNLSRVATGELLDINRASAGAADAHDENAVYAPLRREEDLLLFEKTLLPGWGIRWWKIETQSPPNVDDEDLPQLLEQGVKAHAITIQEARMLLAKRLRVPLTPYQGAWSSVPPLLFDRGVMSPEQLGVADPVPDDGDLVPPSEGGPTGADGSGTGRDDTGAQVEVTRGAHVAVAASKVASLHAALERLRDKDALSVVEQGRVEHDANKAALELLDALEDV